MTKFSIQHSVYLSDRVFVNIDNRLDVALIRSNNGLRIEVYPITNGEAWDDPSDRFAVQESEIRKLEQEMSHDA